MTGRYRPRAHIYVEAFRFDGQPREKWPRWLADRGDVKVWTECPPGQPASYTIRNSTIGELTFGRGCWVGQHDVGKLGVFTDQAFIASYEPVEAAA